MKFTCNQEDLLNAINIVSKAVSTKSTLKILECIVIKTCDNGIKLVGNDLELGIESSLISANIIEQGIIALEAKLFFDIVKRVNGVDISISFDKKYNVTIKSGSSKFDIMGVDGSDFPKIPEIELSFPHTLNQMDLKNMINQTIFSISADESKEALTGELMEINNNLMVIVAVDGFRISYRSTEITKSDESKKLIIPGKTLREISKILSSDENELVHIYSTDKHVIFDINGNIIVSRLINGDFIKYQQAFTQEFKTKITANIDDLVSSIERASLVSRDAKKVPVKLEILNDKIILSSETEMGSSREETFVETEGEPLTISFNPKYLVDALKVIEDDKTTIQFNSPLSPCIIKPEEGDSYKYLVLPLRI